MKFALQADSSTVQARILGADVTYKLGAPGRHVVLNSLAVLAAASLAGADLALAALALANLKPPSGGRGERITLDLPGGAGAADRRELQRQSGLDAGGAGAARPGADRCRAAGASPCSARCWNSGPRGAELHRGLVGPDRGKFGRSRVLRRPALSEFLGGPSLRTPGRLCRDSRGARSRCARRVARGRRGDGQGLARLEDGPDRQGADPPVLVARRPRKRCPLKVDPMLYWLADLSSTLSIFNVFRYLTVRTGGLDDHRAGVRVHVRALDHRSPAAAAGQGPADPRRRAEIASSSPRPARRPWAG